MVSLVARHGVEYLFATVVLMGVLQLIAGGLRLGKFIRLVPHPVMLGFVNGLAIVILTYWMILPEERYLEDQFGDVYRAYARKTRRWL